MHSEEFLRLEEEAKKGRNNQCLSLEEAKILASRLSPAETEDILRLILRDKSFLKRSITDVYVLMGCIKKYEFFDRVLDGKGERALQQFCKHLHYTYLEEGRLLYEVGEVADKFYILMTGTVQVRIAYKEEVVDETGNVKLEQRMKEAVRLGKGQMFGETISKEKNSKRAASVLTLSDCELFEVKRKDYETVDKCMTMSMMKEKYLFFEDIDLFNRVSRTNLEALLYITTQRSVSMGQKLYVEGEAQQEIFIVKSGQFKLDTTIRAQNTKLDLISKLKATNSPNRNSRKFEVAIVGPKSVLGEVDSLMGVPALESCTCVTEHAEVYMVLKKDLMTHMEDFLAIEGYLSYKHSLRNQRLQELNKTFNRNNLFISIFRDRDNSKSSRDSQSPDKLVVRRRTPDKRLSYFPAPKPKIRGSIYSTKKCWTEQDGLDSYVSQESLITGIIRQKRKYSQIRKNNDEPLFKFSQEIPVYLKVKMGLNSTSLKKDDIEDSPIRLSQTFAPKKLSETMRPKRRVYKREPRKSANLQTSYGKFFQTLLDV